MKIIGRVTCLCIFSAVCWGIPFFFYLVSSQYLIPVIAITSIVMGLVGWWLGTQFDKVRYLSERDVLTNLYNRRYVFESFPKLLNRVKMEKQPLSVLLVDVDNLKKLNDGMGHLEGDVAIRHLANVLLRNTKKTDVVARIGGDEFFIIAPFTDKESTLRMVERIQQELVNSSAALPYILTASIGAATYPVDAETLDGLFIIADTQLYVMKQQKPVIVMKTS